MAAHPMDDRRLLERVTSHDEARARRIQREFLEGFRLVDEIGRPAVTIFGSARIQEGLLYDAARETGRLVAEAGLAVITGGGPGIMEAANRGAKEAGGLSVGFAIELPHEEKLNDYLDISMTFEHFYARKVMLVKAAEGFILFPGGFGTLDELFESLTLIQTEKVEHFPVVLAGTDHWGGLVKWLHDNPLRRGLISPEDETLLTLTDDPREAVIAILDCYRRNCAESPYHPAKADAQ
jgi:uncharacterized protein (TIGR00730 family)